MEGIDLSGRYEPKIMMVVYKKNNEYYMEQHNIKANGVVGPGIPLSKQAITKIANTFASNRINKKEK